MAAYKKKCRGAELIIQHLGDNLLLSTHYFNKHSHYDINLKEKTTEVTHGTQKYKSDRGKSPYVKWRDEWLGKRFINCDVNIDNELWYMDITPYSFTLYKKINRNDIFMGNDFRNIQHCKFVDKVGSKLNSLLKQERDNVVIPHNDKDKESPRLSLAPGTLESCIKAVKEEFPFLLPPNSNDGYEYAQNIVEITQGREPNLDDLPF